VLCTDFFLCFWFFFFSVLGLPESQQYLTRKLPAAFLFKKDDKEHPIEFTRAFNVDNLLEFLGPKDQKMCVVQQSHGLNVF
jgi:hypothetical protein